MKRVHGKACCPTVLDARGRAHLMHPGYRVTSVIRTVCDRDIEATGKATGKSCGACAEGAPAANRLLRLTIK